MPPLLLLSPLEKVLAPKAKRVFHLNILVKQTPLIVFPVAASYQGDTNEGRVMKPGTIISAMT